MAFFLGLFGFGITIRQERLAGGGPPATNYLLDAPGGNILTDAGGNRLRNA
jgi:hypothetical protein